MSEFEEVISTTRNETDKRCTQCGGVMNFDPSNGNLTCPYCGHTQIVENLESSAVEIDLKEAEDLGNHDWGLETKTVICKNCSAQSIYDALEIANVCPYCGSNHVMEEKGVKTLAPGGVVIFEVTAKEAGDKFSKWLSKKWFCPTPAKQSAKPEKFKGVYLPNWTFDTNTNSFYIGEAGVVKTRKKADGKTESYTQYHHVNGRYNYVFDDFIESGSNRINKDTLKQIEPFDTENNKSYKPEYIAGFSAERYSIGLEDAWESAGKRMKDKLKTDIELKIKSNERASYVRGLTVETKFNDVKFKYLLLPIWISSFVFNGKTYEFMVNGQTGKVSGTSPIDKVKVAIVVIIVIAVIVGIIYFVNYR